MPSVPWVRVSVHVMSKAKITHDKKIGEKLWEKKKGETVGGDVAMSGSCVPPDCENCAPRCAGDPHPPLTGCAQQRRLDHCDRSIGDTCGISVLVRGVNTRLKLFW